MSLVGAVRRRSKAVGAGKRRAIVIAVAAVVVSSAAVAALSTPAGRSAVKAVARAVTDPAAVLALRSPGPRKPGALTQSKPAKQREPAQRDLARKPSPVTVPVALLFAPLPAVPAPDELHPGPGNEPLIDLPPTEPVPLATASGPRDAGGFDGPALFYLPQPGLLIGPPASGSQGPRPPAAVPEPATWLGMVLGSMAIGFMLRRSCRTPALVPRLPAPPTS